MEVKEALDNLTMVYDQLKSEKESLTTQLTNDINELQLQFEQYKKEKESEFAELSASKQNQEITMNERIVQKDEAISEAETVIRKLKDDLEEFKQLKSKEKEDIDADISEREREKQVRNTVALSEVCRLTPRSRNTFSLVAAILCDVTTMDSVVTTNCVYKALGSSFGYGLVSFLVVMISLIFQIVFNLNS